MIMKKKVKLATLKYILEVPIFFDNKGEFNLEKQLENADKAVKEALKPLQEKGTNRFEPVSIHLEPIRITRRLEKLSSHRQNEETPGSFPAFCPSAPADGESGSSTNGPVPPPTAAL